MRKPNNHKSLYITVPDHVHRAAKAIAALEGRLLGDVVIDAITAYVESRFPQLGSPKPFGNSRKSKNPTEPNPPKSPPITTGPGSVDDVDVDVSEELPPARDGENPFADEDD